MLWLGKIPINICRISETFSFCFMRSIKKNGMKMIAELQNDSEKIVLESGTKDTKSLETVTEKLETKRVPHPNAFFQAPIGTKIKVTWRNL